MEELAEEEALGQKSRELTPIEGLNELTVDSNDDDTITYDDFVSQSYAKILFTLLIISLN